MSYRANAKRQDQEVCLSPRTPWYVAVGWATLIILLPAMWGAGVLHAVLSQSLWLVSALSVVGSCVVMWIAREILDT